MPNLTWDRVGDRQFEAGLDRGVLYLPDGSAVPWNGLTSVIEKFSKEATPVYFDGVKINENLVLGDFAATMKAVTYPDEFVELEGYAEAKRGVLYADQMPIPFGLCYRSQIGNDVESEVGYKIHIIYNLTAIPNDKTYETLKADPTLMEFEWEITAIPEEIPGNRPTAHIIVETDKIDPWLLEEIEEILYGSSTANARLIPMVELADYIANWFRIRIIDNGDGTWTAISNRDGLIFVDSEDQFTIFGANAIYLDDATYLLSDTEDISQIPELKISDNGDGTWTASTDQEGLIELDGHTFTILNANVEYVNDDMYRITDTTAED